VAGITLNETNATLNEGQTVQLTANVSPELADNKNLAWTSSNTDVATVDQSGLVTAIKKGTTVITATSTDGSEVSTSCDIVVLKLVSSIILSKSELTIAEGMSSKLTASVYPNLADDKTLHWYSSDESIATVDQNGNISAIAKGSAVITAQSTDGSDVSASCNVTVVRLVSCITLSENVVTLVVGKYKVLSAYVSPSDANDTSISWSSSNSSVARVDNGVIFALTNGDAIIRAYANDGSGIVASCHVTVITLVSEIIFDQPKISLEIGEFANLSFTVYPNNASNKSLDWTSSDESVATVMDGYVLAKAEGYATITARATDGSNVFAECKVCVTNGAGIDAVDLDNLYIFTENSTIYCKNVPTKSIVRVFKTDGSELFYGISDGNTLSFQPSSKGLYIVVVNNISQKLIVR
jgi:uncharacterized protein YjdB